MGALTAGALMYSGASVAAGLPSDDLVLGGRGDMVLAGWAALFEREVDRRLYVPVPEQKSYTTLLERALADALVPTLAAEAFVLVDRNPMVQAAFVVVRMQDGLWYWVGASPVSTGKPGTFEHFVTPLGAFAHSLANPDFRSEGTFNSNRIRGYGKRGRRVFDFGWQVAQRGWGSGGTSSMRLQMHATDPDVLERRLGSVASEGCVRIPGTLNAFLDMHGVLDKDYDEALARGESLWVMKPGRTVIPWAGRYMVVVDSLVTERPAWSSAP